MSEPPRNRLSRSLKLFVAVLFVFLFCGRFFKNLPKFSEL